MIALGLASMTSCQEPLDELSAEAAVKAGGDFEIQIVTSAMTKTIVDDYCADDYYPGGFELGDSFAVGDRINLFHAEHSAEGAYSSYANDGAFYVTEVNDGIATLKGYLSEDLMNDHAYDWFAIYPYDESITNPEHAVITFPSKIKTTDGNPATALAASPLAGSANSVKGGAIPQLHMKHLASAIELVVTNFTDDDITVSSIEVSSTAEALCGTRSESYGWCEALAGTYEFNTIRQDDRSREDWTTMVWDTKWEEYAKGSSNPRFIKLSTIERSQKITIDVDDVVVPCGDYVSFFVPIAPTVFEIQGTSLAVKINDLYKPLTPKPWKEYYWTTQLIPLRPMFQQGQVNRMSFTYAFTDIENNELEWSSGSGDTKEIPTSWFSQSSNLETALGCNAIFRANAGEGYNQLSYMWLSSLGHAFPGPFSVRLCYIWDGEGPEFVIPVQHVDAGKSIVIESVMRGQKEGDITDDTGTYYIPGGPAFFMCEYSLDQGKTWKPAELQSDCRYVGNVPANFAFPIEGEQVNIKAVCPINSDFDQATFLYRMRCVNAEFSISDHLNGRAVGGREAFKTDIHGEPSHYAGDTYFHTLNGDKYGVFAKAYVE